LKDFYNPLEKMGLQQQLFSPNSFFFDFLGFYRPVFLQVLPRFYQTNFPHPAGKTLTGRVFFSL